MQWETESSFPGRNPVKEELERIVKEAVLA
jgi:hypothetical protein